MGLLDGRTVIVAGASRGIGKAIALECAKEGARVAVIAREGATPLPGSVDETAAAIRAAGGTAIGVACDIARSNEVDSMLARVRKALGEPDLLINAVARFFYDTIVDTREADWDAAFDTNMKGAFLLTRAVLPSMITRRRGHIIHLTGSGAREVTHVPALTGATKAALDRFTLGLAHEVREHGIAANLFDPGGVKTERSLALRGEAYDWTGFAMPADVAPAAVWLASRTAEQMTGRIYGYADWLRGER